MTESEANLRWGILGTARIAERVAVAIEAADGAELIGIASRSAERAQNWAAELGGATAFASYEALLNCPEIDAVYIPLPPSLHAEWTIRAAECGKHVLCEKPLAVSPEEAQLMVETCRRHNVQLIDGVMWVHHPRAAEMLNVIRDGRLGALRRVTTAFTFHREFPASDLRMQRAMGGGSLLDLGWYCVGATLWAFDEMPTFVFANARYQRDVDVNFAGMLWFDGNRFASFDCGFDTSVRRWVEVAGTDASLVCDDFAKPWDDDRPRFWVHGSDGKMSEHICPGKPQEVCMIEHFVQMIRSGIRDDEPALRSVQIQQVCTALDESARTGRVVEL